MADAIVSLSYAIVTLGVALLLWRQLAPGLYSSWLIAQAVVFLLLFWAQTLSDDWVTVFWSAELVALYWVAAKCNDRTLLSGTFLIGLAVVFQHFGNALAFLFESPISQTFTAGIVGRWSAGLSVVTGLLLCLGWIGGQSRGNTSKIELRIRGARCPESLWICQRGIISGYDSVHAYH